MYGPSEVRTWYITAEADFGEDRSKHSLMCAKAGHKVVLDGDEAQQALLRTPKEESDWMIRLALGRQPGQVLPQQSFFSMRDMLENGWDLQTQVREVKVSLEYDFKRRTINVRIVRIEHFDAEHLAFDTVPWGSAEEGEAVRTLFNQWRQENCLKNLEDWRRGDVFLTHHLGNRKRRARSLTADAANSTGIRQQRGATGQVHLRGGSAGLIRMVVMTFLATFMGLGR